MRRGPLVSARMTDTADVTFTLRVEGDRDERLRRLASGILTITPKVRLVRVVFVLSGGVFVLVGLAALVDQPAMGIVLVPSGIYLITHCGTRRAAIRRLVACYGRSRFAAEPTTCVLTSTGLRCTSDTSDATWAWQRVAEVREHEDGLLLVFDGNLAVVDLPPSAFVDAEPSSVARHVAHWIATAGAEPAVAVA